MKKHLLARSGQDVARFYDAKYKKDGYDAFRRGVWDDLVGILEDHGGPFGPDKRLLDAGCGHGEFIDHIKDRVECTGIEISPEASRLARARLAGKAWIHNMDMSEVPRYYVGCFDYVTCFGALEHTMDPNRTFAYLHGALVPGGVIVVLLPLEFEGCMSHIAAEKDNVTNERFASPEEWVSVLGAGEPLTRGIIGQDSLLIYRRPF